MDTSELNIIYDLESKHFDQLSKLGLYDSYYEGEHRLQTLGFALPPQMAKLQTVVNWPRIYIDEIVRRLHVEGFRLVDAEDDEQDKALRDIWRYNRLDVEAPGIHTEMLALKSGYVVIGPNDYPDEPPIITVESPFDLTADIDHRTGTVRKALRIYDRDQYGNAQRFTLYMPNYSVYGIRTVNGWQEEDRDSHNRNEVPVVPFVNRSRSGRRAGVSEMSDVMGLTDAACRSITNLQAAQELMAVPQRYILGADESMFQKEDGTEVPKWEAYISNILAIPEEGATVGQFGAAELRNFTETLDAYARQVSATTGLPPDHLGMTSDNPASADAIRSQEARHVKNVEAKQQVIGVSWARVMHIAARMYGLGEDYSPRSIEPIWRDPATPTFAQKSDAVVKLVDKGILDIETALEELGYGAGKIEKIMTRRETSGAGRLERLISEGASSGASGIQQETTPDNSEDSQSGI